MKKEEEKNIKSVMHTDNNSDDAVPNSSEIYIKQRKVWCNLFECSAEKVTFHTHALSDLKDLSHAGQYRSS